MLFSNLQAVPCPEWDDAVKVTTLPSDDVAEIGWLPEVIDAS